MRTFGRVLFNPMSVFLISVAIVVSWQLADIAHIVRFRGWMFFLLLLGSPWLQILLFVTARWPGRYQFAAHFVIVPLAIAVNAALVSLAGRYAARRWHRAGEHGSPGS
jgi:hypothetical protein